MYWCIWDDVLILAGQPISTTVSLSKHCAAEQWPWAVPCSTRPVAARQTQADCCTGGAWRQLPFSITFPASPHNSADENILDVPLYPNESCCLARQTELEWWYLVSDLPVLTSTQSFYFSHHIFSHFEKKWCRSAELPTGMKPSQISVEPELCWIHYMKEEQ